MNKNKACVTLCAIWFHLFNLKSVINTRGGVLLLVIRLNPMLPPTSMFLCIVQQYCGIFEISI